MTLTPEPAPALAPEFVSTAAQLACLLEASAPKPGNVSPGHDFRDMRYEDFLASGAAIGHAMAMAIERPIGPTVLASVRSTKQWVDANTNLGIILLFAPIARGALAGPLEMPLRHRIGAALEATSVADASAVYEAIRLANPGGLGDVAEQDVRSDPTATLRDVMRLAQNRDAIAREYVTDFSVTFDIGVPTLLRARRDGLHWASATTETFLTLLAAAPDTHIARKTSTTAAAVVCRAAQRVVAAGGVRTEHGQRELAALDQRLRDATNITNPGATADLTAASLFVALLGGAWRKE